MPAVRLVVRGLAATAGNHLSSARVPAAAPCCSWANCWMSLSAVGGRTGRCLVASLSSSSPLSSLLSPLLSSAPPPPNQPCPSPPPAFSPRSSSPSQRPTPSWTATHPRTARRLLVRTRLPSLRSIKALAGRLPSSLMSSVSASQTERGSEGMKSAPR